jgi:hypothetical protein
MTMMHGSVFGRVKRNSPYLQGFHMLKEHSQSQQPH